MKPAGSHRAKRRGVIRAVWLCVALGCASSPAVLAQAGNSVPIRVGSERVAVPVFVADKERHELISPNLTAGDFHLFEDGQEQRIQSVTLEHIEIREVDDSLGRHVEYSNTPAAKWSTADLSFTSFAGVNAARYYLLGYQPPPSATGSCHQLEVRLDRRDAQVFSRSEYCNVQHSASDPLSGTKFGAELEHEAAGGASGAIHLAAQARVYQGDSPRVRVSIDFPWDSLERSWINGKLSATIGIVGVVYQKDGGVVARFSDQACCSSDIPSFVENATKLEAHPDFDVMLIPSRFDTQLSLPPGEYVLRLALSDGRKFGRAAVPLKVEGRDEKHPAISAVAFSPEYRDASAPTASGAAPDPSPFPARLTPLVGNSLEITPATTARFRSERPLVAYFEVYESSLAMAQKAAVETRLRIVNSKSGKLVSELEPVKTAFDTHPQSATIPIAQFIPVRALPKGEFRLEIEATDGTGDTPARRTADFVLY